VKTAYFLSKLKELGKKMENVKEIFLGYGGHLRIINQQVPYMPELVVERIDEHATLPTYTSEGDSGMDVYATEDVVIRPQETLLIRTGLRFQIPQHPFHALGYRWEVQVRPRSGVSFKTKLVVVNSPGTVDNFYTDEVKVIMRNTSEVEQRLSMERTSVTDRDGDVVNVVDDVELTERMVYGLSDIKGQHITTSELPEGIGNLFPENSYLIRKGERFAQLVLAEVIRPLAIVEGTVTPHASRQGGFGHSGTN
jgi:deoxyuridine 5'-triphosphate nucleotidohydrolase